MLIILEGLDLAGKSYIAEQLLKRLPHCYYMKHGNRPQGKTAEELAAIKKTYYHMMDAWHAIDSGNNNMIFDRFYPSELVYSFPKRGYEAFQDMGYKDMENWLLSNFEQVVVLYIYTSKEEMTARFKIRGDDYMEPEDIDILLTRYNAFIAGTRLACYQVQSGTAIEEIMEKLNEHS